MGVLLLTVSCLVPVAAGATPAVRTVRPGATFRVVVDGFAPRASVQLRLVGTTSVLTRPAGRDGVLRTTWTAPRRVGDYRLVLGGAPAVRSSAPTGNVVVLVPRVAVIAFRVRLPGRPTHPGGPGGSGTQGVQGTQGTQGTHGAGGSSGSDPHGTARTGVDLAALFGGADVLLAAGIALLALGLRRRRGEGG